MFDTEAATGVLWEKLLLEISQNWQENTCARVSFLIKSQAKACTFIKKDPDTDVFLWILRNFCEHLSKNTSSGCFSLKDP